MKQTLAFLCVFSLLLMWLAVLACIVLGFSKWDDLKDPVLTVHGVLAGFAGLIFAHYFGPKDEAK